MSLLRPLVQELLFNDCGFGVIHQFLWYWCPSLRKAAMQIIKVEIQCIFLNRNQYRWEYWSIAHGAHSKRQSQLIVLGKLTEEPSFPKDQSISFKAAPYALLLLSLFTTFPVGKFCVNNFLKFMVTMDLSSLTLCY